VLAAAAAAVAHEDGGGVCENLTTCVRCVTIVQCGKETTQAGADCRVSLNCRKYVLCVHEHRLASQAACCKVACQ
jgi:hypothetical protein